MGDHPKPPDDPVWTELERTFFASAPPEAPEPGRAPPRLEDLIPPLPPTRRRWRVMVAWRPPVAATLRGTTRVLGVMGARGAHALRAALAFAYGATRALGAAGARASRRALAGATSLLAALWGARIDRRRVAFGLAGAWVVAAGFSVGVVAARNGAFTSAATAPTEAAVSAPAVDRADSPAVAAPVAVAASPAAPQPAPRSAPEPRSHHAVAVAPRPPRAHRTKPAAAAPSPPAPRVQTTAYMDRETYWALEREHRVASAAPSRPLFSR